MARAKTESSSVTEREAAIRRIEQALGHAGASVEAVLPFAELRTAVGDHVLILVRALVALASVLALVGLLGLTSTFSTSVLERTRELAVMKAIGASSRRILTLLLSEGLLTALASAVLAFLLTLPLTYAVESAIGRLGFLAPLPFVLAPSAVLVWIALVSVFGLLSIWFPARRAASTSVREALGSV
jgi:putative ABC transport system permease protein